MKNAKDVEKQLENLDKVWLSGNWLSSTPCYEVLIRNRKVLRGRIKGKNYYPYRITESGEVLEQNLSLSQFAEAIKEGTVVMRHVDLYKDILDFALRTGKTESEMDLLIYERCKYYCITSHTTKQLMERYK